MSNAKQQPACSEFETKLREAVMQYSMLKHPFYVAWTEGRLSKAVLSEYAKQYYAHVRAFPTYVSGVHSHCEDLSVRRQEGPRIERHRQPGGTQHP